MKLLHDWNDVTYTIEVLRHAGTAPGGMPIFVCTASIGDPEIRHLVDSAGKAEVTIHDVASETQAAGRMRRMIETGVLT